MSEDELPTRRALYENLARGTVERAEVDGAEVWRVSETGVERVHAIVDAFLAEHGENASEALAEALSLSLHTARAVIERSLSDR